MRLAIPLLLLLAAAPHTLRAQQEQEVRTLDRIIAVVNDGIILQSDLDAETRSVIQDLRRRGTAAPDDETLRKQVLERLILTQAQLQRANELGIRVTDAQVNEAVQRIAANNRLALTEFRDRLVEEGYDYRKFRNDLRHDLITRQLRKREVEERITLSDQEVKEYMAIQRQESRKDLEHHLRQIFLAVPEGADSTTIAAVRERIEAIRARLAAGEDFVTLAAQVSEGQRALEGGDLGWRTFAQMPTRFVAALENMEVGDLSEPVRSPIGFHLLKLEEVRGEQRHVVSKTRARHILLGTNAVRDDEQARETLAGLRARVLAGDDFGDLARAYSEDYNTAIDGGNLGWLTATGMPPAFEEVANSLQPGETSEPFRTAFGWHLVQVLERRAEDNTRDFLRGQAREQLFRLKVEQETELWLRRLRDEAYVEYRIPD